MRIVVQFLQTIGLSPWDQCSCRDCNTQYAYISVTDLDRRVKYQTCGQHSDSIRNWQIFAGNKREVVYLPVCERLIHTGRLIMFSVITNIYNKKTKAPTLMELFIATGKLKKVFWQLEMFDVCTTGDIAHIDAIFKFLPHTRQHGCIVLVRPTIATWLHWPKGTDHCSSEEYRCSKTITESLNVYQYNRTNKLH
jgi:hypothetical protein